MGVSNAFVAGWLGVAALSTGVPALAEDRVLIMTISDYPGQPLEGVKHDANNGYMLAKKLGYETSQAVRLRDAELTLSGMKSALQSLVQKTRNGDRVFVYFSGHGGSKKQNNVCEQSIISQDAQHFFSGELASYLEQIKDVASKVTVMLDSCHSGGVLHDVQMVRSGAKAVGGAGIKAKSWVPKEGESCSNAVNYVARGIPEMRSAKGITDLSRNYVYITAARDNEYALDSPENGGLASTSILKCLDKGIPNTDNSGVVSVGELVQCAQFQINQNVNVINAAAGPGERAKWLPPHLKIEGNSNAPILGAQTVAVTASSATGSTALSQVQSFQAPVKAVNTLRRIFEGQDARWGFSAQPTKTEVTLGSKIGIHYTSNQPGYVYVLYVGSDGKEFKQLYPIALGDTRFLAKTKGYVGKDGGVAEISIEPPLGDNHFLVLLADSPRDFSGVFKVGKDGELTATTNANKASSLGCAVAGGTRNAKISEGPADCMITRNASVKEGGASNEVLTGYGAAMFVVKGMK